MKILISVAAAAVLWPAMAFAQKDNLHAEVIEWVIGPCMEVAAALDVKGYNADHLELGIKRAHIAKLMVASRESAIQKLTKRMKASASWEDRRAAYPIMLRICLAQLPGMK